MIEGIAAALGPAQDACVESPCPVPPLSDTVRAVDIPDWFYWICVGLVFLQVLALVPIIRRLRGLDPAVRAEARGDLVDTVGNILLFGGLLLSQQFSSYWGWLALAGFLLMGAGYAWKGVKMLRARRRSAA